MPRPQSGYGVSMSRRVVVTGASSGIGEATARAFASRGWEVVGVARRADRLAALAADTGIRTIVADLTDQDDVDRVRDDLAALGPVHALVNNAGGAFGMASVEASSVEDWRAMFDINVLGTKRMITALLPLLRAGAADAGVADIVAVTSIAGHVAYENGGGYNAAKFAEHALMGVLRLELRGRADPGDRDRAGHGQDRRVRAGALRGRPAAGGCRLRQRRRSRWWPTTSPRRSCTPSNCPATSTWT